MACHGSPGMPLAAQTHQLAPPPTIGMAIGAELPPTRLAMVRTGGMGAEGPGGIDVPAASGEGQAGWRCGGAEAEGCISASCSQAGQSGLWVKPANDLGSRVAFGGFVAAGMLLPLRQSRRDKMTSSMRTMPTTRAHIGSDRMISPSIQVVEGMIISCFEHHRYLRALILNDTLLLLI